MGAKDFLADVFVRKGGEFSYDCHYSLYHNVYRLIICVLSILHQLQAVQLIVSSCERALKQVSDFLADRYVACRVK